MIRFPTRNPTKCIETKENVIPILSPAKFKLQLSECVHSKTCVDEGFS